MQCNQYLYYILLRHLGASIAQLVNNPGLANYRSQVQASLQVFFWCRPSILASLSLHIARIYLFLLEKNSGVSAGDELTDLC